MGRYQETIREAQEMLRVHPNSEIARWAIGTAHLRLGDRPRAKEMFVQATAINPSFPHALNNLGILAAEEGRIAEAETLFLRAKEILGRKDARPYANLGSLYEAAGRRKEALEMYEAALAIQPNAGPIWYSLARLRALVGDGSGAQAALARAIDLDKALEARAAADPAFKGLRPIH
jgi:Flp pilus assembly protein TadD